MEKQEFALWFKALERYYPESKLPTDTKAQAQEKLEVMELWRQELIEVPYEVAVNCLRIWARANKWPPKLSDIIELTDRYADPEHNWEDAWSVVRKMASSYGSCRYESDGRRLEACFEHFDEITKQVVEVIGWSDICESDNQGVLRAQFRDIYNNISARAKAQRKIPKSIKLAMKEARRLNGTEEVPVGSLLESTT